MHDFAVGLQPLRENRRADFRQVEPRARHRDTRADVDAFGDLLAEILRNQMAPRVECDNAARLAPLREGPDGGGGKRIGEIGPADRIERTG